MTDDQLFPASRWFAQWLGGDIVFYDPDWSLLRQASPPGNPDRLTPDARNTPWLAKYLQDRQSDQFEAWVDHVRTALPQIRSIKVREREEDHHAYFQVCYRGGYEVTSSGLSDGTLRILALTLLPYLDPTMLPRLLVTEEPENGIHPKAIEAVVGALQALVGTQVWVSTHSPIVLAHHKLSELLIARLDGTGEVSVIPGTRHPQLREWKASPDIGTLYAAGVLS
jgi:predicted ATPase